MLSAAVFISCLAVVFSTAPENVKWKSVSEPIQEQVATAVEWENEARQAAGRASADAQKVKEAGTQATGSMTSVLVEVGNAKAAMDQAQKEEKQIASLRDHIWQKAKQTAMAEIPKILPELRKKAQQDADKAAKKAALVFEKKMQSKAKAESAQASKVYTDVMKGAGKTAAAYAKLGDGIITQSAAAQVNAGLAQGQADQFLRVGDVAEAQKLMQQSRGDMNVAMSLNSQATGMYDTANQITGQLPAYADQAAMAGYHAAVMYDPAAQPPPPPLVLAQRHKQGHAKRLSLLSQAKQTRHE